MSMFHERVRHLVAAYDHTLEQQIVKRGSYLACRDEELWKQVEELLSHNNALETHCSSLDPLKVMEDSLKVEATFTKAPKLGSAKQVIARRGLRGLAKAFEILEQAALNLYLGPWREEYKVVKMYSGMFTHYIKPVLSVAQIEKLFGLLGYQCSTRREQLHLQLHTVGSLILDDLLCLSCAFFLARCECCLLQMALENHSSDVQWELCMVRERLRGYALQVALDNTKMTMGFKPPLIGSDEESHVDLYTDKQVTNKSKSEPSRCSLPRVSQHSSTGGETTADLDLQRYGQQVDVEGIGNSEDESNHLCSHLQSSELYLNQCIECTTIHNISCAVLHHCSQEGLKLPLPDEMKESAATSPHSQNIRPQALNVSPPLRSSPTAMSSLSLCDNPKSLSPIYHPLGYHDCCDLKHLDYQVVCLSCRVFHSATCEGLDFCQSQHTHKTLGKCSCGRTYSRKPLVLCTYCGTEYCNVCWYRNPFLCICGQTLDQGFL
ncbi:spermatogenesis associated 2-like isoform X2 [Syngnathus scovelli]|uniref:spermatogenesis associated 2-like isoform X2 n=1 Tax=Syngnathus scovelli TaxID=161590 RepID=UPI00210F600B|nr:spermatogenesis associated 2-like isoform X2 [Syngnathus scovelli]